MAPSCSRESAAAARCLNQSVARLSSSSAPSPTGSENRCPGSCARRRLWLAGSELPSAGRRSPQPACARRFAALADAVPLLALDRYEHAYQREFGANAQAYIDAFMRNVDWVAV